MFNVLLSGTELHNIRVNNLVLKPIAVANDFQAQLAKVTQIYLHSFVATFLLDNNFGFTTIKVS